MELITQQNIVADRIAWFLTSDTPPYRAGRPFWGDERGRDVAGELRALDPGTATVDQVNEILGRDMVYRLECNECGEVAEALVQIGEEPNYETNTAYVCRACLERALRLVTEGISRHEQAM